MRPIPGQPGLFLARRGLRGLGDLTLVSKLADVTSSYNTTNTNATKLLAAFGPLSADALLNLGAAIKALKSRDPETIARVTGAQFAGNVRMGLAAAKGNIIRAEGIINGGLPGHDELARQLLTAASNVIDAIGAMVNNATEAIGTATGYAQSVGLGRGSLGIVIADDVAIAAIVAVGLLIGIALLLGVYVYVHQSQVVSETADQACARDAAAGHPCTGTDWVHYRTEAVTQQQNLSPIPNLDPLFQQAGNAIFYGGLLAVAAVIGYGVWTTLPAAQVARGVLTRRASSLGRARGLQGLHGTPAQHRVKAEQLLAKAQRERERGRYMDALVTASAANAEAQWVDERLKGATYHEVVLAKAGLRMEAGR